MARSKQVRYTWYVALASLEIHLFIFILIFIICILTGSESGWCYPFKYICLVAKASIEYFSLPKSETANVKCNSLRLQPILSYYSNR